MIEVVYNKAGQTEDNIFAEITLPKNIRQIGMPSGNRRIYIEDYVMTYLNQMANPNSSYARGAILVGETVQSAAGQVVFISGAIAAQNLELDLEETTFDGETWDYIYQEVKQYFPELSVVGWFLSRMGFSTEVNDMIVKLHMENFGTEDKVLYIMDSLEGEDALYMLEGDYLRRQTGYYIYYARNEAMQNFMVDARKGSKSEAGNEIDEKDGEVIKNYKRVLEDRAHNVKIERINRRLSAVCSGLTVAVLALGIAVFSNYQMLSMLQTKLVENGIITYNDKQESGTEESQKQRPVVAKTQSVTEETEKNSKSEIAQTNKDRLAAPEYPQYYVVQNGDTLSSISFKMYNSVSYVSEIMEANEFGNSDEIHEGDTILIPTINKEKE
ncbi:MAG: LysM peptidoglycan-binding domain-containing protein [Lachnospiraceae bacterium]